MVMEKKCSGEQIVPDICMYVRKVLLLHLRFIVCVRCIFIFCFVFFFLYFPQSVSTLPNQAGIHLSIHPSYLLGMIVLFLFILFYPFPLYLPYLHPEGPEVRYEMRIMRNGVWRTVRAVAHVAAWPETDLVF